MVDPLLLMRAVHFAATMALAGTLVFGAAAAGPALRCADAKAARALRSLFLRIAWAGFVLALLSAAAWLVLAAAQQGESVQVALLHSTLGHAWLVRLLPAALLAVALSLISPAQTGSARWGIAALAAAAFTLALVHSGHAAAGRGWLGTLHRAADGLHLLAASAWLGGLVPLALLLAAARRGAVPLAGARDATLRFSIIGVVSVAVVLATGVVNGWILAGGIPGLVGTGYGRLLLIKVALFVVMVAVAAVNRLHLTPQLVHAAAANPVTVNAVRPLVRNCLIEVTLGLAILLIVGALGTLPPGAVAQPEWPFALRYSDEAFGDPQARATLVPALWMMLGGASMAAAAILAGVFLRRLRWWLIAAAAAMVAAVAIFVAPALRLLMVEAFPTTYYVSPTRYSASSIVRGAELFAIHCAACHGRQGRGDGPAGRFFRVKPADLTADHVYAHTDGDLYWWLTHGIGDVMPPMAVALDETARWNVIDFVRANADAARLAAAPAKVTDVGYRAPDFSAACPDGATLARDTLGGRGARLVVTGSDVAVIASSTSTEGNATCRADDAALATALALFRGQDAGQRAEFLVDAAGMLRAAWSPGGKPDWSDGEVIARELAAMRDHPAATRPTGSHLAHVP